MTNRPPQRPGPARRVADEGPPTPSKTLADLAVQLVAKTVYGHTIGEVLALSLSWEQAIDAALVKSLGRDDQSSREVLLREVVAPLGRERKLRALQEALIVSLPGVDADVRAAKALFELRDRLAHSAFVRPDGTATLEGVTYHRGQSGSLDFTDQMAPTVIDDARRALDRIGDYLQQPAPAPIPDSG